MCSDKIKRFCQKPLRCIKNLIKIFSGFYRWLKYDADAAPFATVFINALMLCLMLIAIFFAYQTTVLANDTLNNQKQQIEHYRTAVLTGVQVRLNQNLDQVNILKDNEKEYRFGSAVPSFDFQGGFVETVSQTDVVDADLWQLLTIIDSQISTINNTFKAERDALGNPDLNMERVKAGVAPMYISSAENLGNLIQTAKNRINELYGIDVPYVKGNSARRIIITEIN